MQGWSSRQLVGLNPRSRGCESHPLRSSRRPHPPGHDRPDERRELPGPGRPLLRLLRPDDRHGVSGRLDSTSVQPSNDAVTFALPTLWLAQDQLRVAERSVEVRRRVADLAAERVRDARLAWR